MAGMSIPVEHSIATTRNRSGVMYENAKLPVSVIIPTNSTSAMRRVMLPAPNISSMMRATR